MFCLDPRSEIPRRPFETSHERGTSFDCPNHIYFKSRFHQSNNGLLIGGVHHSSTADDRFRSYTQPSGALQATPDFNPGELFSKPEPQSVVLYCSGGCYAGQSNTFPDNPLLHYNNPELLQNSFVCLSYCSRSPSTNVGSPPMSAKFPILEEA